jgi:N6-L-threonylcarbamoyladenine synthase
LGSDMKILAIDTSCDETAAAVTQGTVVLSNVIWSQASQHAQFGGVMPSLAQRMHRERIDFVIDRALRQAQCGMAQIGAIAVTAGPGLAIALEVGITKAKEISAKYKLPLIPVNHIEGHLLSSLARASTKSQITNHKMKFPALGLVVSGGHTELILIKEIGKYEILAKTQDDALGEALDKAARMLGLGYPGGAILEKMARLGNPKAYPLPLPMSRSENKSSFSYSGLKTAFWRLTQQIQKSNSQITKQEICDLASSFQNRAFQHLERVVRNIIRTSPLWFPSPKLGEGSEERYLLIGGGVAANIELRKRLRKLGKELDLRVRFPYSSKLVGDNAAMIGVAASFRTFTDGEIDRKPRWPIDLDFSRE